MDELLLATPALAVIIDTFEQRVQWHQVPQTAATYVCGLVNRRLAHPLALRFPALKLC